MRKSKRILVLGVVTLMGLLALSGCHGGGGGSSHKMRFINQSDSKKVVEFTLEDPTVLARVHMAVYRTHIRGTYVLKDADTTAQGRVIQDDKGYTLISKDEKKQRLDVNDQGLLKDESGDLWKLDDPKPVATLKEW